MNVVIVQNNPAFGDVSRNIEDVSLMLSKRKDPKPDLVVLSELFASGYQFTSVAEAHALSEKAVGPDAGPTVAFMKALSRETGGLVVGGFPCQKNGRVTNAAAVFRNGELVTVYDKVHLFDAENRWFSPGEGPLCLVDTPFGPMGVMICFDWLFPEVARSLALSGAMFIAHPANWVLPFGPSGMILRSVENRIFTMTANRVGTEERGGLAPLTYIGQSQILSPSGEILARAPGETAAILEVSFDPAVAKTKTVASESDAFRQRRPDLYHL